MIQVSLFDPQANPDICANRHRGNSNSLAANRATRKPSMRAVILEWYQGREATCEEAEAALGIRHQTAGARLSELKKSGDIVDTGRTRPTSSGCFASVLRAAVR